MTLHEIMNNALIMWAKILDIDLTGSTDSLNWSLESHINEIREAQEIDNTGLTSLMLLNAKVSEYAENNSFTLLDAIKNGKAVNNRIKEIDDLLNILNKNEAITAIEEFQTRLKDMAFTCEVEGVYDELIKDTINLAYVRRDALIATKILRKFNFKRGKRAKKLQYNKDIIKFWNINSALRAAEIQPTDGITLIMIRDPVVLYSHFIFLIKDGENITIWTDKEKEDHPLQKYMSRSRVQERRYDRRVFRLRFPYELFNLEFNDEGRFVKEDGKNALVRTNVRAVPIKPLKELPPDEVLWILMMFEIISKKSHPRVKSYTGEGTLDTNRKLIGSTSVTNLTVKDVNKENLHKRGIFKRESTGQNNWLERRYANKVPNVAYNIVGSDGICLITDGSKLDSKILTRNSTYVNSMHYHRSMSIIGVEPTSFGTHKDMESDRLWVARYNQAVVIQRLADKEFTKKKEKIKQWYENSIIKNINFILESVARGELIGDARRYKDFGEYYEPGNILKQTMYKKWVPFDWHTAQVKLYGFNNKKKSTCYLSGQVAWIWTLITPHTARDLIKLTGENVPEIIENWTSLKPYVGNSILQRLDPVDWLLEDPWKKLRFNILIGLSRMEFNKLLHKYNMPRRNIEKWKGY